jgi:biotin carboxyl carrier protein
MKTLRIRVNDKVYDVTVEVLSDDDAHNGHAPVPKALPNGTANGASNGAPKKAALPAPRPITSSPSDVNAITAPIAGTVQKVFVQAGGQVEAKAPVILLDAMKMDTYIYAPRAGTIAKVDVNPGDAVRVGQRLFEYEAEA